MKTFLSTILAALTVANDNHKTFQQIALENGYAAEQFTVITKDGYVSEMYRIPGSI
jgi:hypothetical protein